MSETTQAATEAARHAVDATMAKVGTSMTMGGSGAAVVGGFTLNEMAIVFGMVVGAVGLAVQWYYRHKLTAVEIRLKQEQALRDHEAHVARMEMYR